VRGFCDGARVRGGTAVRAGAGAGAGIEARRSGTPPANSVYSVAELLGALMGSTGSDRILCHAKGPDHDVASVRYLSLDAEARFRELFASARAVVFAGGTLEPRSEFAPLYAGLSEKSGGAGCVNNFSGRHVVPAQQIFARYVTHGPGGNALDFRKEKRGTATQMSELRAIMTSASAASPGGAIFFFPSFDFLAAAVPMVGSQLGGKAVFVETRGGGGGDAEGPFRGFAAAVRRDGGAVLLAVNGAKLSEGIDFKDDLCRLVVVVGLPYPNAGDLGLLEKMRFLDRCRAQGAPGLSGKEFYQARCMKGVNQCVGRSIRHAGDWAAILLLDHRYAGGAINGAVSLWLREQAVAAPFQAAEGDLRAFYARRATARLATPAAAAPAAPAKGSSPCASAAPAA